VCIELPPAAIEDCLRDTGFGFLFAPLHHGAMQHAAGTRRDLGVRTVFNLLGPLTNPAGATHQLLGVYDGALVVTLAEVLRDLGCERALVVHGADGLDELSPTGATTVAELLGGRIDVQSWTPEDLGVGRHRLEDLQGGDLQDNVRLAERVLAGERGALQDAVAMNAGAALYVAGVVSDAWKGTQDARLLLESGQARRKLDEIVACTQRSAAGQAS
jgi:anthranilate phosphoribosyltransferase